MNDNYASYKQDYNEIIEYSGGEEIRTYRFNEEETNLYFLMKDKNRTEVISFVLPFFNPL